MEVEGLVEREEAIEVSSQQIEEENADQVAITGFGEEYVAPGLGDALLFKILI